MNSQELFQAKVSIWIKEWDVRINDLKAKAEKLGQNAQAAFLDKLEKISAQKDALQNQFEALKSSSPDTWQETKSHIGRTLTEMDEGFTAVLSHFS